MRTCSKCGCVTDNDHAKFCKKCGSALPDLMSSTDSPAADSAMSPCDGGTDEALDENVEKSQSLSQTMEQSETEQDVQKERVITADYLKENSEIGGWLAFFLFSICAGGTLSAIIPFFQIKSEDYLGSTLLLLTDVSLGVMLCALAFYTLYSFIQRKPDAVYLGKLYVVTTFLSNLLVLVGGEYEASGLGSLPQIIRGLVWGVVWYGFLCISTRVEEVIPKEYRRKTDKDYYITAVLYIVPIILFVGGVASLTMDQLKQDQPVSQTIQIEADENTDGMMAFKVPQGFTCERKELEEPKITLFALENEEVGNVSMCSGYDNDMSRKNFDEYCKAGEDKEAGQYTSRVECVEKRTINGKTYWYRVTSYETGVTIYWRFVLLFDDESAKTVVVSAYDAGSDAYIQELLNSIRFR